MLKMMSVEPFDRCKPICCTSIKKAVKINVDNACLTPICIFTVTSNILQNQVLKKTERYLSDRFYFTISGAYRVHKSTSDTQYMTYLAKLNTNACQKLPQSTKRKTNLLGPTMATPATPTFNAL